jgi:excisionase family DNA binding protein
MSTENPNGPMPVARAAVYASCHPKTVLRALRRGELVGYQRGVNCTWRIYQEDLDSWIRGEKPKNIRRAA